MEVMGVLGLKVLPSAFELLHAESKDEKPEERQDVLCLIPCDGCMHHGNAHERPV